MFTYGERVCMANTIVINIMQFQKFIFGVNTGIHPIFCPGLELDLDGVSEFAVLLRPRMYVMKSSYGSL